MTTLKYPDVHVQLVGQDGNAFMVLGLCQRAEQKVGLSKAEIDEFMKEAKSGDYNHLLATCIRWFDSTEHHRHSHAVAQMAPAYNPPEHQ